MNQKVRQETFEKIFKEHLKIETYSISIDSLFSPRLKNKINYKPYYQRNYVWDYTKATYFIESILLGTEVPPLIFFHNNSEIEIIDGRQRFETILRFMDSQFVLKPKGLYVLKQLKNFGFDELAKNEKEVIDKFLDAKLRIIEFKLVNEPPLDKYLEDRIKKEIFSRYNSGITPLKKSEIDNAIYDEDSLSNFIKDYYQEKLQDRKTLWNTFFKSHDLESGNPPVEKVMAFIRRNLVLPMIPVSYYARGTGRTDLLSRFYEKFSDDNIENEKQVLKGLLVKVNFLSKIKEIAEDLNKKNNRLALETFLWGLYILEYEEIEFEYSETLANEIVDFIDSNYVSYTEVDYGFNKEVMNRYSKSSEFISKKFGLDASVYLTPTDEKRFEIKDITKPKDTNTKLSELESLRLNKPEPSRISIDDIVRLMTKRRFLVRPSYQRKEVINPSKASSIIESILLGITLPAIFLFKRKDGISEVIDGQQRLLTLLGFIGSEYTDEKGKTQNSKNHKFSLRKLRILKELDGEKFNKLKEELQNKIYDFQLYIVEIDENQNPHFDPIDLFIRLNDKPYPIREHSFEMWNSWVDVDIIDEIKKLKKATENWFYFKQLRTANDRDRMETEELLMSLCFLEYLTLTNDSRKTLEIYQKTERLNARIGDKASISSLLQNITESEGLGKQNFISSLKNVKSFIKKVKYVLLDKDATKDELFYYLKLELDELFKASKNPRYFRRTMQDFYFLWYILGDINFEMVKFHRLNMKKEIKSIFIYLKSIPEEKHSDNMGYEDFINQVQLFKKKYKTDSRRVSLNESEKLELIKTQSNESNITGAPVFLGDDIEVDHEIPLALGGQDEINNLKIVHKDENRKKGPRI